MPVNKAPFRKQKGGSGSSSSITKENMNDNKIGNRKENLPKDNYGELLMRLWLLLKTLVNSFRFLLRKW